MLAQGDLEGYTVKVHALKSSARIIGAPGLSDMALKLEEGGHRKLSCHKPCVKNRRIRDEGRVLKGEDKGDREHPGGDSADHPL